MNSKSDSVRNIVIIDDSPEDRARVRGALLKGSPTKRYVFHEAANGQEGLNLCMDKLESPIDCVFLDLHMPYMDGLEFLAAIKDEDGYPQLPIVVLTGSSEGEDCRTALRAGAQDFVTKEAIYPTVIPRVVDNAIERFAMSKRLYESERAADSANRAKSSLISNISHELRTPMTAVLGLCELLLDSRVTDDQRNMLQMIRDNGTYLVEIVNDLLDLSKMEVGMLELEPVRIHLRNFVNELTTLMKVRATESRTTLKSHVCDSLPEAIVVDPIRLRQILLNLLSNAIKFAAGGEVRLETYRRTQADASLVEFEVCDTGCGIPQSDLESIFEPFVQSGLDSKRKHQGTGLGLSISRRLANAMDGHITVESKVGEGSCFTVSLPLIEAPWIEPRKEKRDFVPINAINQLISGCRVLIADDIMATRMLLSRFVEAAGGKAQTVENGVELINRIQQSPASFDIIVTDVQMPLINGFEATREIRKQGILTPIVVLTADAFPMTREKVIGAGATDVVTKPINRQLFLETLAAHSGRRS